MALKAIAVLPLGVGSMLEGAVMELEVLTRPFLFLFIYFLIIYAC